MTFSKLPKTFAECEDLFFVGLSPEQQSVSLGPGLSLVRICKENSNDTSFYRIVADNTPTVTFYDKRLIGCANLHLMLSRQICNAIIGFHGYRCSTPNMARKMKIWCPDGSRTPVEDGCAIIDISKDKSLSQKNLMELLWGE